MPARRRGCSQRRSGSPGSPSARRRRGTPRRCGRVAEAVGEVGRGRPYGVTVSGPAARIARSHHSTVPAASSRPYQWIAFCRRDRGRTRGSVSARAAPSHAPRRQLLRAGGSPAAMASAPSTLSRSGRRREVAISPRRTPPRSPRRPSAASRSRPEHPLAAASPRSRAQSARHHEVRRGRCGHACRAPRARRTASDPRRARRRAPSPRPPGAGARRPHRRPAGRGDVQGVAPGRAEPVVHRRADERMRERQPPGSVPLRRAPARSQAMRLVDSCAAVLRPRRAQPPAAAGTAVPSTAAASTRSRAAAEHAA